MSIDEMINFETNKCITMIQNDIESKIIDGIFTVSQKNDLCFNEEEIVKMLLMFKPMQKELKIYKKALYEACEDLAWEISSPNYTQKIVDEVLERVRNSEGEQ